jgi:hypothetical protein
VSYARFGPNSDVYVFSDGAFFNCIHAGGGPRASHCLDNEVQMLDHAYKDREAGLKVPDAVFGRLINEITGIPYETDVEAEIREVQQMMRDFDMESFMKGYKNASLLKETDESAE